MIDVFNLCFEYSAKRVLHDASFSIPQGAVTALVGPNGAGKTTLLRCIAALEKPLSGKIIIDGLDVAEYPREIHRRMGYLSDFFGLYNRLTVRQCLTYLAWCQNIPEKEIPARIMQMAQDVEIVDFLDKKAHTLSRGYRQRLGVALSLIHDPKILILDEPASGMDPEARIGLSSLMQRLKSKGMTIIVSSHILAELEDYCTDMLVIRDGRIADHVMLEKHRAEAACILRISVKDATPEQITLIQNQRGVTNLQIQNNVIECFYSGGEDDRGSLLKFLIGQGVNVHNFEARQKTLQKAYMDLAENSKKAREKKA
jgi:ABC-2 type transport system ATP-binding protein